MTPAFPDAPYDGVTRVTLDPVPLAVVRHTGVRLADLPELFDRGYAVLGEAFEAGALTPTGPGVAIYHGNPLGVFDLEIGYPVEEAPEEPVPTAAGPTIIASALPSGPAAATTLIGSYDGLGDAWAGLMSGVEGEPSGIWIEVYVTDPSTTPVEELRTDLVLPLRA